MKAFLSAALLFSSAAFASIWDVDTAHSSTGFAVKHMMISTVRGTLGPVTGTVDTGDDKDLTKSKVDVSIDVKGINTGEAKRDEHLKSAEFFDVTKFPTATFKSKKIEKGSGEDAFKVTGDLTLHGVTKEVVLDATVSKETKDPWGNFKRGMSATTKINRKDFGLGWNKALETGGVMVSDDVQITIDGELNKKVTEKKKT